MHHQTGTVKLHIDVTNKLQWSVQQKDQQVIEPSAISLQLQNEVLGDNCCIHFFQNRKSKYYDQCHQLY
jgi:hypothetical protein